MARPATDARTRGYRRAEVLAAAAQAAVLLAVAGYVLVEAVRRLVEPHEVASGAMVVFGIVGVLPCAVRCRGSLPCSRRPIRERQRQDHGAEPQRDAADRTPVEPHQLR
jgi:hypothetical protein